MNKYTGIIGFTIVVVALVFLFNYSPTPDNKCKEELNQIARYKVDGKVTRKFIDSAHHNSYIIEARNYDGSGIRIDLKQDASFLFDSLEAGYLIQKQAGSLKVFYGKKTLNKSVDINLNCGI